MPDVPAQTQDHPGTTSEMDPRPRALMASRDEIAPSYLFLASSTLSSYDSGQVLAPGGSEAGTT